MSGCGMVLESVRRFGMVYWTWIQSCVHGETVGDWIRMVLGICIGLSI